MKKNILAIILLVVILFNINFPQYAFSCNTDNKTNSIVSLSKIDKLSEGVLISNDTSKVSIVRSGSVSPEKPFNYSNTTLNNHVSFDLKPISKRKFSVSFLNKNQTQIAVKIYDVIGNLIIEENVYGKGYFYKEYDLSFYKSDLFIIEVGNSKYNKTKSLVAG